MIPHMNFAKKSSGKHKSIVDNSIVVSVTAPGVIKRKHKNCPSIIITAKDGNPEVEDYDEREIFISLGSCGNLANDYLLQYSRKTIIQQEDVWVLGYLKRLHWERNLATSVHVDKFPLEANPGDAVSIGAYPRQIGIP